MMTTRMDNVAVAPAVFAARRPAEGTSFTTAQRIVCAVFACALSAGFGDVLLQLCGMTAADVSLLACAVAGVVGIAVCVLLAGRGRVEARGLVALAAVVLVALVALGGQVLDGLAVVLNHLQTVLDARTAVYGMPYLTQAGAAATPFCVLFSLVLGAVCAQISLRGNVLVVALLAVAATVPVVFGFVGASPWLLVLAAGLAGCFVGNAAALNQVNGERSIPLGALATAIALGICAAIGAAALFVSPLDGGELREQATAALDELRYGKAEYAMPEGKIASAGERAASDRVALNVTTDAAIDVAYLRGFTGDVFANGSWEALPAEKVTASADLFYWLREDGFSATSQLADAAEAVAFADAATAPWAISYEGARARYTYLPYGYAEGAQATITTDFSQARREGSASQASFTADANLLWKAYKLQLAVAGADDGNEEAARYRASEQAYRDFVYDNYLAVPQSAASTFERLFGQGVKLTSEEAKALINNYFDNYVAYEDDPEAPEDGTDVVSYFLVGGQEGYSIHYATAATLLLRYYGVPARYVEGYQLTAASATGSREYALTESNAHAWVEYYLDGVGWVVYDPTPGFGDESRYEKTDNTTTSPLATLFDQGSHAGSSWVPEVTEDQPEEEPESQRNTLADFGPSALLWLLVGLLVGALAAFIVRAVLLRRRTAQQVEELRAQGTGNALAALFSYGIALGSRGLHVDFANEPYVRQAARAEEAGLLEAALFTKAAQVNDRMLFASSAGEATAEEQQIMGEFVDQAVAGVNAHAAAWDKFVLKYVYCIM